MGAAFLYTVLSIYIPHGSIVPSAIVFLYTSSVLFVTLRTETSTYCNKLSYTNDHPNSIKQMLMASVVASFTLGYAVVSSGGNSLALNIGRNDEDEDENPDEVGHLSHYMFFYTVMMLGSMYLAMLATG
uniref:Uncharacterized protein n=1 Tax=Lygus hesperus TaxID=30085 RepID=A0A0A9YTU3_LYGHE